MAIQGTMGYCEGDVKSATYGVGQYVEFVNDATELGFTTNISPDYISARNDKGLITGEWSSKHGGQLAWSE